MRRSMVLSPVNKCLIGQMKTIFRMVFSCGKHQQLPMVHFTHREGLILSCMCEYFVAAVVRSPFILSSFVAFTAITLRCFEVVAGSGNWCCRLRMLIKSDGWNYLSDFYSFCGTSTDNSCNLVFLSIGCLKPHVGLETRITTLFLGQTSQESILRFVCLVALVYWVVSFILTPVSISQVKQPIVTKDVSDA